MVVGSAASHASLARNRIIRSPAADRQAIQCPRGSVRSTVAPAGRVARAAAKFASRTIRGGCRRHRPNHPGRRTSPKSGAG